MTIASGVGLATGLNTDDIISKLMSVNSRPITLLQTKITTYNSMQNSLEAINRQLTNLQTSINDLKATASFEKRNVSVSDTSAATATVSNTAAEGTYSVIIKQLAQAERIAAQGFVDTNTTPIAGAAGSFSFKFGDNGTITKINVDGTTTLSGLRDAINKANAGVRASIINDGTVTNPYRIVLTSERTGAANDIIITKNDTSLNFATNTIENATANNKNTFNGTVTSSGTYTGTTSKKYVAQITTGGAIGAAKFKVSEDGGLTWSADDAFTTDTLPTSIFKTSDEGVKIAFGAGTTNFAVGDTFSVDTFVPQIQNAQDAIVEIDGVQVNRSSNTVTEAIDGVTLNLSKQTSTPFNVTVKNDNANSKGNIVNFITAYNALVKEIATQTNFDIKKQTAQPLFGDTTTRNIKNILSSVISSRVPGLTTGITSLSALGITTKSDGTLSYDNDTLDDIIADSQQFDKLKAVFAVAGQSSSSHLSLVEATKRSNAGTFAVNITQAAEQAQVLGNQAISVAGIASNETLTFKYDDAEVDVSLSAGDTIADIVEKINNTLEDEDIDVRASDNNGKLLLKTVGYGSSEKFTVVSDKNGAVNTQTGIGTVEQTDSGLDVAGSIGAYTATGKGQELSGTEGTSIEGLKILVSTNTIGNVGDITVSYGIAQQLNDQIESMIDPTDGMMITKNKSISDSIDSINKQIDKIQTRLEKEEQMLRSQFTKLETIVSQYQSQGSYITNWINSLNR